MPNPIDLILDPISLSCFAIYAGFILLESMAPAKQLPQSPAWRLRGLLAFICFFFLSSYLPLLWDSQLSAWQIVDISHWGVIAGTLIGLFVYEAGVYAWHRLMHRSSFLWRWSHQMHHSAERLDTWGAFWFSPIDMAGWTALGSLILVLGIGVAPQAATNILLITFSFSIFQHSNIRTPRWLGYLVQRPESHSMHHAQGYHRNNYSDLPIFDILFASFENPRHFAVKTGIEDGDSLRIPEMLLGRDLNTITSDATTTAEQHTKKVETQQQNLASISQA